MLRSYSEYARLGHAPGFTIKSSLSLMLFCAVVRQPGDDGVVERLVAQ